mgnify:CR=1 FL=1
MDEIEEVLLAFCTNNELDNELVVDPFTSKLLVAEPVIVKLPEKRPVPFTSSLYPAVVLPIARLTPPADATRRIPSFDDNVPPAKNTSGLYTVVLAVPIAKP